MAEIPPIHLTYPDGALAEVKSVWGERGEIHIVLERPKKPAPPRPKKLPRHEEIRRLLLLADLPPDLTRQIKEAIGGEPDATV